MLVTILQHSLLGNISSSSTNASTLTYYWNHRLSRTYTAAIYTFYHKAAPLFVMRVWSSVRSGLLFSHWMYFFHISTCWASWGEFWGGTEGAFLSSPFITVSYSWITHTRKTDACINHTRQREQIYVFCDALYSASPLPLSWHSCSLCFDPRSSFWPSAHWFPDHEIEKWV